MSVDVQRPLSTSPYDVDDRWVGTPLATEHWLESPSGFPAGSLISTAASDGPSVVASVRGVQLTRRQIDEVLAFTQFMAGEAFTRVDRAELEDDIVDAFTDSPRAAARFLAPLADGVGRIAALDPVQRCQRRLRALTNSYSVDHRQRSDGGEPDPIMRLVARYNPLVRYWAATGLVLVGDALTARFETHQLVHSLVGSEPEPRDVLIARLTRRLDQAGPIEIAELAAAQLRLIETRSWLRDLGKAPLAELRDEVARALPSALDPDIVVQHVTYRAALSLHR